MYKCILTRLFLIIVYILPFSLVYADKQGVQFIGSFEKIIPLNSSDSSKWEYTTSKLAPSIDTSGNVDRNKKTVKWKEVHIPGNLDNLDHLEHKRIWYRKKFFLSKNSQIDNISIFLGKISDRDKTYLNGKLIGKTGTFNSNSPESYDKIRLYEIPNNILLKGEENVLLIEVERFFDYEIGLLNDDIYLGSTLDVFVNYYKNQIIKLVFIIIYATVGVYFLFLYLRRSREKENLFFALLIICLIVYNFSRSQFKYYFDIELIIQKQIEYIALLSIVPLFCHFILSLLKQRTIKLIQILNILFVCVGIFYAFSQNIILNDVVNKNIVQPSWSIYISITIYFLVSEARKLNKDALFVLSGMSILFVATMLDVLSDRGLFIFPRVAGFAFLFFIVSIAIILANKFVRLSEEIEDLNKTLEKKVELRTEELEDSLTKVNKLKIQQDGDYFLISLLLKPLIANQSRCKNVKIDFFCKQKKSFEFRNRKHEIGGDILISSDFILNHKKMVVFANGDAMGKSIQGASGALVLGVVFNAIVARTKTKNMNAINPEHWLKKTYLELQNVFESFNGSMFISVVIGMVEEDTGVMYFINAEHPWTVLYRDKKANFLEEELTIRKIGVTIDNTLVVRVFRFCKGDAVFIGSDGRDDIQIDENFGIKIINEDENEFLNRVEDGDGDLEKIVESIQSKGILTDDLSLMKLQYFENTKSTNTLPLLLKDIIISMLELNTFTPIRTETLNFLEKLFNIYPDSEFVNRLFIRYCIKLRHYKRALNILERHTKLYPEDNKYLYLFFIMNKYFKKFNTALLVLERLILREPANERYKRGMARLHKANEIVKVKMKSQKEIKKLAA